jgi:hypothetical protein
VSANNCIVLHSENELTFKFLVVIYGDKRFHTTCVHANEVYAVGPNGQEGNGVASILPLRASLLVLRHAF